VEEQIDSFEPVCVMDRKEGWAVAKSPILITTITLRRLKQRGYIAMLDIYTKLNPSPRSSTEGNLRTAVYATECKWLSII
jgi:hypothetical protein